MTRIYSFTINGASQIGALRSLRVVSEVNTVAQIMTATLLTPALTSTPAMGHSVSLAANNGSGVPYNVMFGKITKVDQSGAITTIEAQSSGLILNRLLQTTNDWAVLYGMDLMYAIHRVIESDSSGLNASSISTISRGLDKWAPSRHSKAECLRRLIQLSQVGSYFPYVFFQSGGPSANFVRIERLQSQYDADISTGEGGGIIGRPKWENTSEQLINDITVQYCDGIYQATDSASISTYGRMAQTVYRPDMGAVDAAALASNILYEWKAPRKFVTLKVLWEFLNNVSPPNIYPVLAKRFSVTDRHTGFSGYLAAVKWIFEWPGPTDTLVLGSTAANTAEYLRSTSDYLNDVNRYGTMANIASDVIVAAHDAEVYSSSSTPYTFKTFKFPAGLRPMYRIKWDVHVYPVGSTFITYITKNGNPYTPVKTTKSGSWVTMSIDMNTPLASGDTLGLVGATVGGTGHVRNFRVCQTGALTAPPYSLL